MIKRFLLLMTAVVVLSACSKNTPAAADDSVADKTVTFRLYRRSLTATDSTTVSYNIQVFKFVFATDTSGSIIPPAVWDTTVAARLLSTYPLEAAPLTFTKVFSGFRKITDQVSIRATVTERRSFNATTVQYPDNTSAKGSVSYTASIEL